MESSTLGEIWTSTSRTYKSNVAVILEGGSYQLTYESLEKLVDKLAKYLREVLIQEGYSDLLNPTISIITERNIGMMVSILAILKIGGCYVPVDPNFPPDRQSYIFSHSRSNILILDISLNEKIVELGVKLPRTIIIDKAGEIGVDSVSYTEGENSINKYDSKDLAYILYTSGSTGKPKGVMVMHKGVINTLQWFAEELRIGPQSVVLGLTTYCFDISVLEMIMPLLYGATLVIADTPSQKDPFRLIEVLSQRGVTVMQATPTTYEMMLATGWTGDDNIDFLVGGEAFRPALLPLITHCRSLRNVYGPTETTIWSSSFDFRRSAPVTTSAAGQLLVPIGKPISETVFYVVEEEKDGEGGVGGPGFRRVARGDEGELWIGGVGVARGYFDAPDLTAQRFLCDPFLGEGQRVYRTGDLVRQLDDGNYVFIRRLDDQVKLNGYRIELAEVEAVLASFPAVEQAVVLVREGRLEAFIKARKGREAEMGLREGVEVLRRFVARSLTSYMIPSHIVVVESFPQTANGKLDRRALVELYADRELGTAMETVAATRATELKQTYTEQLSAVGHTVLGVCDVATGSVSGISMVDHVAGVIARLKGYRLHADASLAGLGVDSLASVLLVRSLTESLGGLRINVKTVFGPAVTVRSLSACLYNRMRSEKPDVLATLNIVMADDVTESAGDTGDLEGDGRLGSRGHGSGSEGEEEVEEFFQRLLGSNLAFLEGLRGVLILLILWDHFGRYADYRPSRALEADTSLFVLLSGFTTALQLRPTRGRGIAAEDPLGRGNRPVWDWSSFLLSRAIGVFPMLWLAMILGIPRWIGMVMKYERAHAGTSREELITCTILHITGMETWVKGCRFLGPYDLYYASVIWNCFLGYTVLRLLLHRIQHRLRSHLVLYSSRTLSSAPTHREWEVPERQPLLAFQKEVNIDVDNEMLTTPPWERPGLTGFLLGWFENRLERYQLAAVALIWSGVLIGLFDLVKDEFFFFAFFIAGKSARDIASDRLPVTAL